jgi:hypothetical protein
MAHGAGVKTGRTFSLENQVNFGFIFMVGENLSMQPDALKDCALKLFTPDYCEFYWKLTQY